MSNGFDCKRNCVKSIALFVSCLLFFTVLPVSTFASVLSSSLSSSSLRPLPSSPPPSPEALLRIQQQEEETRKNAPKEMIAKRTKNSKKYVTPSGIYQTKTYPRAIHVKNDRGGWDDKEPSPSKPTSKSTTSIGFYEKYLCSSSNKDTPQGFGGVATPLSLCLYAGGSSFDQNGNAIV